MIFIYFLGPSRAMQESCDPDRDISGSTSQGHGNSTRQENECESVATERASKPSDSSIQDRQKQGNVSLYRGKREAKQLQIETFAVKDNAEGTMVAVFLEQYQCFLL